MTSSATALPQSATTVWNIDPAHTIAEFKVKHMMIANVKGQFSKVSGVLTLDDSKLANSSVEVTIEAASLETRDASVTLISRARISSMSKSFPPCTSTRRASALSATENWQSKAT